MDIPSTGHGPATAAQELDGLCDQFEQELIAGRGAQIESFLTRVPDERKLPLLRELVQIELWWRRRRGEAPRLDEYLPRFSPEQAAILQEVFAGQEGGLYASTAIQGALGQACDTDTGGPRLQRIHCPTCGSPLDATVGEKIASATCDSCGTSFQVDFGGPDSGRQAGSKETRLIPRYRLGVGGQGEVWLAHDLELDRFVALKVVKASERGSRQTMVRFWNEAELTGKLEHPNIVPVYEAARRGKFGNPADTGPYYAMRVFGNRHLLGAIAAFHGRSRSPEDASLLEAMTAFHEDRSADNDQRLQLALASFSFDASFACDRDLRDAATALRRDPGQTGRSLQEAVQAYHSAGRQPSELRELLNRFIDICNAMAYAHSRGVIHRDLKPQNVMLGEFGETLVVDWGLAKVVGRTEVSENELPGQTVRVTAEESERDSRTQAGTIVGTPAYMPPEQASGHVEDLGPPADIYSLGGILFAILTGKPPHSGDSVQAVLEVVRTGKITPPTLLMNDVPKPLEAVCLKALSKHVEDRYAEAKHLAADVGRWLADEPVRAWREPVIVRARRWARKNQTLVTATAAVVLVSAIGLGAFSAVVNDKNSQLTVLNNDLDDRNIELDQANTELTAANTREISARKDAEQDEEAAREQSQLALSTLTDVIFDVQAGLLDLPGGAEVRRRLLTTTLEKLDHVATEFVGRAAVDRNTMAALTDMGEVILEFGVGEEGNPTGEGTQEQTEFTDEQQSAVAVAHRFYMRAHEIATELAAREPTNFDMQRDLALSFSNLGDLQLQFRNTQLALNLHQQSLDIRERLAALDPTDSLAQRDLSISLERMGDLQLKLGNASSALQYHQQSLDIFERLADSDPANVETQCDLSISYHWMGDVYRQIGDAQSALSFYQRTRDIHERLVADDPTNAEMQRGLSIAYERLGDVHVLLGDIRSTLEFYEQSLDIRKRLAEQDPGNVQVQRDLFTLFHSLGAIHLQLGLARTAQEYYQQGLDIATRLAELNSASTQEQRSLAISYSNLADVHRLSGELQSALELFQQSHLILETLAEFDPTNAQAQRDLSVAIERLGDLNLQMGDMEAARDLYQRSLEISERMAALDLSNGIAQRDLSVSYDRLGDLQMYMGEPASALEFYQQSLSVRERLVATNPSNTQSQEELSLTYSRLGGAHSALLEHESAIDDITAAILILDQLIASGHNVEQAQSDRAFAQRELRKAEREAALVQEALADWETFIAQPGARSRLSLRVMLLTRAGRFDDVPQSAAMLRSLDAGNFVNLYNAACGYALCANAIAAADSESLTPQQQEYIDLSLACLRESIAAGFSDIEYMQQDSDLAVLRDLPEFEELMHNPPAPALPR